MSAAAIAGPMWRSARTSRRAAGCTARCGCCSKAASGPKGVAATLAADAHYGSVSMIGSAASVRSEYALMLGDRAHAQVDGTMVAGSAADGGAPRYSISSAVSGTRASAGRAARPGRSVAAAAARKARFCRAHRGRAGRTAGTDANEDIKGAAARPDGDSERQARTGNLRRRREVRTRRDGGQNSTGRRCSTSPAGGCRRRTRASF